MDEDSAEQLSSLIFSNTYCNEGSLV